MAFAFYGLTRSLEFTIDSIQRNVLGPVRAAGHAVDVFVHTYSETEITNARSHEEGATLNATEWQLLEPAAHSVTDQVRAHLR